MANEALIGAIINPAQADIPGALSRGRKTQAKKLAGDILGQTQTGKLGRLLRLDSDLGLELMKSQGIPTNDKGRLENWAGTVVLAGQFAQGGDMNTAADIIDDFVSKTQAATEGKELAQRAQSMAQRLRAGDPTALQELTGLSSALQSGGKKGTEQQAHEALLTSLESDPNLTKEQVAAEKLKANRIKLGLKGRSTGSAAQTIAEEGTAEEIAKSEAVIAEATKFASAQGAVRSKIIDTSFTKVESINKNLLTIDKAIEAIRGGANTGAIDKLFPSIKEASINLAQIQGELALNVVGATTFGALSEGELKLAKEIALPDGLQPDALIKHLQKRKAAQIKLATYFEEQIDFLDDGGSVAGFMRKKKREQKRSSGGGGGPATVSSQADFDALPSGARFIEDGVEYTKP